MWSGVGFFLVQIAVKWFSKLTFWQSIFAVTLGLILGLIISYFGFSKLAKKNTIRILEYPEKVCIFAFQRWQMYVLIIIMMSMGIFMRTSSFIPKFLLAPVYIGIGSALFISSFVYYKNFFYK